MVALQVAIVPYPTIASQDTNQPLVPRPVGRACGFRHQKKQTCVGTKRFACVNTQDDGKYRSAHNEHQLKALHICLHCSTGSVTKIYHRRPLLVVALQVIFVRVRKLSAAVIKHGLIDQLID
eukprot:scaffold3763_cov165-Amphora_coffeaeformis.AAC.4